VLAAERQCRWKSQPFSPSNSSVNVVARRGCLRIWAASNPPLQSLIVTTDHGRGVGEAWRGHGGDVAGAEAVWIAALGPGIAGLGEGHAPLVLAQVATTVAAPAGDDFRVAAPRAAPPLPLR
jgi:hypothetical protein